MKFLLQLVCAFVVLNLVNCVSEKEVKEILEKCKKSTGASDDDMKIVENIEKMPQTKTQFCMVACYYKALGAMDANNKFMPEKLIAEVEPIKELDVNVFNQMKKAITDCGKTVTPDKDECESAKVMLTCVDTAMKKA